MGIPRSWVVESIIVKTLLVVTFKMPDLCGRANVA